MNSKARVLIVDDEAKNRELLTDLVEMQGHEVELAGDGFEALAKAILDIDLVLLDVMMPGLDGFEVARRLRADPRVVGVPVIMVTALSEKEQRLRAVEAGANDFITKPVDRLELEVRMGSLLRMKKAQDEVRASRDLLEVKVQERTTELRKALSEMAEARRSTYEAHLDTIRRLAVAAEYKDEDTAAHILRMAGYARAIGALVGLSASEADNLYYGSLMHDVGKIGTPDAILLKPAALTPEEREVMKKHTVIGGLILGGSESGLLMAGEEIALTHHEWWDGSGYPRGLSGETIPLWGRICAIADVYDALTTKRPYKEAMPKEAAFELLTKDRGRHFDPGLLDVFLEHSSEILQAGEAGNGKLHLPANAYGRAGS
jgi:putative two-component system response regulator